MKTYDETIDAIFSKGDALIEQRRQKSVKIKQTSYAVSGVCAAAIVGVGIWRMNDLKKLPDNRHSEIETVEEMTTTGTQTETYTTTSTVVSDKEKTKNTTAATTKNTVTSSTKNVTTKSKTTETTQITDKTSITESQSRKTTVQASNQTETTTAQTEKMAAADTTTITTVQPDTTTKTSITHDVTESTKETSKTTTASAEITTTAHNGIGETTTTQYTDDITRKLPSIFNTIRLAGADSLDSKARDQEFIYSYHNFNENEIAGLLKEIHLNVNYDGKDLERDARIYEIKGYSADALIAVKFEGRDDYFLYCNKLYAPETLGEFISAFELDDDDNIKELYRGTFKTDNISSEKAWELMTVDRLLPNVTDSYKEKYFIERERIWITFVRMSDQWLRIKVGIDPNGYIFTDTNTIIPDSFFYISEEKAKEIIENYY